MAFDLNQTKSGRGGKREGAGRKIGSVTKRTREIAEKAAGEGITPLEYLLGIVRDTVAEPSARMQAAIAAAPYVHPRLSAVAHSGPNGGPMEHSHTILEVVGASTQNPR